MSVYVIAEAGMNHDGSLGNAIRMVEVAAEAGADAVKFQLHDAAAESTRDAPSPPYFQHESRWEYFQRTAFDDDQWRTLRDACDAAGIDFVCAPFSLEALERLERIGVARSGVVPARSDLSVPRAVPACQQTQAVFRHVVGPAGGADSQRGPEHDDPREKPPDRQLAVRRTHGTSVHICEQVRL